MATQARDATRGSADKTDHWGATGRCKVVVMPATCFGLPWHELFVRFGMRRLGMGFAAPCTTVIIVCLRKKGHARDLAERSNLYGLMC